MTKVIKTVDNKAIIKKMNFGEADYRNQGLLEMDFFEDKILTDQEINSLNPPFLILSRRQIKPTGFKEGDNTTIFKIITLTGVSTFELDNKSSLIMDRMPVLLTASVGHSHFEEEDDDDYTPEVRHGNYATFVYLENTQAKDCLFLGRVSIANCSAVNSKFKNSHVRRRQDGKTSVVQGTTLVESSIGGSRVVNCSVRDSGIEDSVIVGDKHSFANNINKTNFDKVYLTVKEGMYVDKSVLKEATIDANGFSVSRARLNSLRLNKNYIRIKSAFDYLELDLPDNIHNTFTMIGIGKGEYELTCGEVVVIKQGESRESIKEKIQELVFKEDCGVVASSFVNYLANGVTSRLRVCAMIDEASRYLGEPHGRDRYSFASGDHAFYTMD